MLIKYCELEPDLAYPWLNLAEIYWKYGRAMGMNEDERVNEAIRCMEEVAKRKDLQWTMWKTLGDMYLKKGSKEKALECYSKAINRCVSLKEEMKAKGLEFA